MEINEIKPRNPIYNKGYRFKQCKTKGCRNTVVLPDEICKRCYKKEVSE